MVAPRLPAPVALLALVMMIAVPGPAPAQTAPSSGGAGPRAALSDLAPAGAVRAALPAFPHAAVTDPLGTLTASQVAKETQALATFEKLTAHRVFLWIGNAPAGEPIESWSDRTWSAWKAHGGLHPLAGALFVFADRKTAYIEFDDHFIDTRAAQLDVSGYVTDPLAAGHLDVAVSDGLESFLTDLYAGWKPSTAKPAQPFSKTHTTYANWWDRDQSEFFTNLVLLVLAFIVCMMPVMYIAGLIARIFTPHNSFQSSSNLKPSKPKNAKSAKNAK